MKERSQIRTKSVKHLKGYHFKSMTLQRLIRLCYFEILYHKNLKTGKNVSLKGVSLLLNIQSII